MPDPIELPSKRRVETYKIEVGGHTIFLSVGKSPGEDKVAEVFIDLHKEGSATRALFNCIAILSSLALQQGVPLQTLVEFFAYMKFEPSGFVHGYDRIRYAHSIVDAIFRLLAIEYLVMEEYSNDREV